jgi:ABC-2 type transport system permease protein
MRNVWVVIKHEIISTVTKPSFWLTTFVLPIVIMGLSFGSQYLNTRVFDEESPLTAEPSDEASVPAVGYVDRAGVMETLPPGVTASVLRAFPSEAAAQAALEAGEVRQYYVIPEDYIESGKLLLIDQEFAPLGSLPTVEVFEYILTYNLVGDVTLANRIANPIANVEEISSVQETPEDPTTNFIVSYGVLFIFFFILTMGSSFMLRSVAQEKENSTVEVLLVSLSPRELMLGKILGLGTLALLQMAIWLGGSGFVLGQGDSMLSNVGATLETITFPPGFAVWAILYFLLGYVLYASLLGAIGALAPNARETGQFTFLALFPLMVPLWLNSAFIQTPHGTLSTVLSLFPLTAPTAMLPRLALGNVPLWQPIVGIVLLLATTYVFVWLAARFFRADTLLSNASLNWKRFIEEFKSA